MVGTREKWRHYRGVPVGYDHLSNSLHQSQKPVLGEGDVCLVADPDDAGRLWKGVIEGCTLCPHHYGVVGYVSCGFNTIALLLSCHDWLSIEFPGLVAYRAIANIGSEGR